MGETLIRRQILHFDGPGTLEIRISALSNHVIMTESVEHHFRKKGRSLRRYLTRLCERNSESPFRFQQKSYIDTRLSEFINRRVVRTMEPPNASNRRIWFIIITQKVGHTLDKLCNFFKPQA